MDDLGISFEQNFIEDAGLTDDWVLVNEGSVLEEAGENRSFAAVTLMAEKKSRHTVFLSTRKTEDADRWNVMPSLECFSGSLRILDLHKSRYLQSLDDSIGDLSLLSQLLLTRCTNLKRLPSSIGKLNNLIEVGDLSEHFRTV